MSFRTYGLPRHRVTILPTETHAHRLTYAFSGSELPDVMPWMNHVLGVAVPINDPARLEVSSEIPAPVETRHFYSRRSSTPRTTQSRTIRSFVCAMVTGTRFTPCTRSSTVASSASRTRRLSGDGRACDVTGRCRNETRRLLGSVRRRHHVTDALQCPAEETRMIVSVDLSRLSRILWIDPINSNACIQAGAVGAHTVATGGTWLHARSRTGCVEFSTLGGWIATHAKRHEEEPLPAISKIWCSTCMSLLPRNVVARTEAPSPRDRGSRSTSLDVLGRRARSASSTHAVVKDFSVARGQNSTRFCFPRSNADCPFSTI